MLANPGQTCHLGGYNLADAAVYLLVPFVQLIPADKMRRLRVVLLASTDHPCFADDAAQVLSEFIFPQR